VNGLTVIHHGRVCELQIKWRELDEDGDQKRVEAEVQPVPLKTTRKRKLLFERTLQELGIHLGPDDFARALRSQLRDVWNERGAEDARLINSLFGEDGLDEKTLQRVIDVLQGLNR
jgi:hypothetical protein